MATSLGVLRKRLLTPPLEEILFSTRGFHAADPAARALLEKSARQLLVGYECAMESTGTAEAVERLETLDHRFLGFSYEGAAMALAVRDALGPGRAGRRIEDFLAAELPATHVYLAYIGIGLALPRVPRMLWRRAFPDLTTLPEPRCLAWLIWDGYGYHQAYFAPRKWIGEQYVTRHYPWPAEHVNHAVDGGIGRALWFFHGADVAAVARAVGAFPAARRGDLWGGVGLAATYAGGVGADDLRRLRESAGAHRPDLVGGMVMAAKARVLGGDVVPHNELAAAVLGGMSVVEAADIAQQAGTGLPPDAAYATYAEFRERIRRSVTAPAPAPPGVPASRAD
jgi:hypothetical protein